MAEFTAKDVMALRQKTGMGMMDCKKALQDAGGDMQNAAELLRERMKGKMDARTERATAEGRIGVALENGNAVIVELRTETDFTAKNDAFATMVDQIAKMALDQPAGDLTLTDGMREKIDDLRITTKENVNFARGAKLEGGSFGSYVHHDHKRGALVQIEGDADDALLRGICQHIVAHVPPPVAVSVDDVPSEQLENVRARARKEAEEMGKPAEIAQKIAEGKVRKFLETNTLLQQKFVRDDSKSIEDILPESVKVTRFIRYTVGQD